MSGEGSFSATLTGGVQNISGLLPLLGTQQCEYFVGSALTRGYLCAAATPMSIFGSLGMARAAFKTILATLEHGADFLADMGFEPKGRNLSLIMIDKGDVFRRHLIHTQLDDLLKRTRMDKNRVDVHYKSTLWNVVMIIATAVLSSLSIIPYVHLNRGGSKLTHFTQWTFPVIRAFGGFLTATMMQFVIQERIAILAAKYFGTPDHPETPDATGPRNDPQSSAGDMERATRGEGIRGAMTGSNASYTLYLLFRVLLLTGTLALLVGYVGCFSVVLNSKSPTGPISWLCLEAALSVIRMFLWRLNLVSDDAPPLDLVLRRDRRAASVLQPVL